ncbi:hypothetical protein EDB83DRAFT_2333592 [Lactarius deliciosus]|nr:hypothetical protein EDB83DRAFT_2333592 [Lactarius deliciosus]
MSFFVSFCFILCLAASLKSSPPRLMYVHGHRVHPSPSPPPLRHPLHCAPQVLTATATALSHASLWPPCPPITSWESATPSHGA